MGTFITGTAFAPVKGTFEIPGLVPALIEGW
jgi:hypothetical protein